MSKLRAGTAVVDITPPVGAHLAGWAGERYSHDVHMELTARALYLENETTTVMLLVLDLVGLSDEYTRQIRSEVEKLTQIPKNHVMVACTHTHSGPVVPPLSQEGTPPPDEVYLASLVQKCAGAALLASRHPKMVRVGFGSSELSLGVNRRKPDEEAGIVGWPPRAYSQGPVDKETGVIRLDDEQGHPVAILFSYGCHPTVGGPSKWIGPDYPGSARALLETAYGSGTVAYFLLGNCGDVRTNYTHPDGSFLWDVPIELVNRAGRLLGAEVLKIAEQIEPKEVSTLSVTQEFSDITLQNGEPYTLAEFQAICIGGFWIVSNPGETFAQIGLDVRREAQVPVLFTSITNGYIGYVPTRDAYAKGGYEVTMAFHAWGLPCPVNENTADIFYNKMISTMNLRK